MNLPTKQYAVIVDGYKFSKDFVTSINALGYQCIHVYSTEQPIPVMQGGSTYQSNDYVHSFIYKNNLQQLVKQLQQYTIAAVIPATEPGVLLADQLAHQLNCPGNDIKYSAARRDKSLMLHAAQQHHCRVPQFIKTNSLDELKQWVYKHQPYPIVLKPLAEAATFGLHIAHDEQQLTQAYNDLTSGKTLLEQHSSQDFFASEFLNGTEYVVNTISQDGKHYVSDFWQYQKTYFEDGRCLYDKTILQSYDTNKHQTLIDYVFSILDALHIKYGAGHCEVMLTKDGPILIEIGARVSGVSYRNFYDHCLGYNLFDLCAQAYLDPNADFSSLSLNKSLKYNAMIITLQTQQSGKFVGYPNIDLITSRPSYFMHKFHFKTGQSIHPTTTEIDSPGRIFLVHKDMSIIMDDYGYLTQLFERDFKIQPTD